VVVERPGVPRRLETVVRVVLPVAFVATWIYVVVTIRDVGHASKVDQAVVLFAGFALLFAIVPLLPSRRAERIERAQLDSAKHLARIAELLEQRQAGPAEEVAPPPPRSSAPRVVAFALLALVAARVLIRR
jgi:ABC-type transport system involved in cytochrome bd biosynthesis fused ATPase/permease subunit